MNQSPMRLLYISNLRRKSIVRWALITHLAGILLLLPMQFLLAQNVPIISGGLGFLDSNNTGANNFQMAVDPVIVAPLGSHLLAESRFSLQGFYARQDGTSGPYQGSFFRATTYLQLDYIVNPKLTIVGGRFLTPFGTYNERLTAFWIPKLQDPPLIFGLGTRTSGSSNGVEVRGVAYSNSKVQVNYTAYFSGSTNNSQLQAARAAGDRVDVYFPGKRVEIGTSYARFLQGTHNNTIGTHFWWQPWRVPVEIRSEYAHGEHSQGYWVESGYRLSQWNGADSIVGRLEPVFRMQQTFRSAPDPSDALPSAPTKRTDFGLDYHFPHEIRLNSSYSRKFATTGNGNIWDISLTYRFLFPAWRGHQ